jgi:hypothetical protein
VPSIIAFRWLFFRGNAARDSNCKQQELVLNKIVIIRESG